MTPKKIVCLLLLIIIIIAAFLRLYNINNTPPGLYPDEAMNGNNALEVWSSSHISKSILTFGNSGDGFRIFYPENNGREGLFIDIEAISVAIFGNTPWALRGVSAIFGILTVLGIYFLTKELFGEKLTTYNLQPTTNYKKIGISTSQKIALLSSFLLATSFWHINFSRIGFRAITAPFWLVWGIYFLLLAYRKEKLKLMALAGFVFGMGIHSYIAYRIAPVLAIAIFLYWFFKFGERRKWLWKSFGIFILFAFIAALPLLYYFAKHPQDFFGRTSQVSVFSSQAPLKDLAVNVIKTAGMFNFAGDGNWRHNYAGSPELFWPVGILMLIGIVTGLIYLFRKSKPADTIQTNTETSYSPDRFPFMILFVWIIIAALPVVISDEGIPHALRSILLIPPIIILSGFGGVWLYEKLSAKFQLKKLLLLISYVLLLILIIEAYHTYFIKWAKNPNVPGAFAQSYVDIGNKLNSLPISTPKYVIVKAGGVDVRGMPMPTQTTMFITDTFTPEKQALKNIHYILPDQVNQIPPGAYITVIE